MLERLTVDDFRAATAHAFTLRVDDGEDLTLEVADAHTHPRDQPATDPSGGRTPFSVFFLGPSDPLLPQRIYHLEHETLGALDVFLVPVARDESGARYEAVFA